MVDVGHAIDHTGIVLPEYGGNAFSRKFLQESLTGGLSLQGGSDSFLRLYGYGMSGNSLFAFHKFLLECLVAYAFTDLAGFDGYAGPFSFFIGSRIDQSMIGLINIISNDELTLVQGVNGLFFCEESWVTQSRAVSRIGKVLPKEIIGTKDQSTNIVHPQTDRTKLSCQKHETSYF